jgi:hypothetical protein
VALNNKTLRPGAGSYGNWAVSVLAKHPGICSSWAMHSMAARSLTLAALSARGFVLAGHNNNRANNNANRWRARA